MGTADTIITVVSAVLAVVMVVWFVIIKKVPIARKIALALVIDAEAKYGDGTGEIKYAEVVGKIYPLLPGTLKIFISEKFLDKLIKDAVEYMKKQLGEKKIQESVAP